MDKPHICIIGSGVAGLSIAKLIKSSHDKKILITILESGSFEIEDSHQNLNKTKLIGSSYSGLTEGQFRVVGGNSLRWGGQMLQNLPWQIGPRKHLNIPPWPLKHQEIYKFSDEVKKFLGIKNRNIGTRKKFFSNFLNLEEDEYQISEWPPYTKRNFQRIVGKNFFSDEDICLRTHTSASKLLLTQSGDQKKIESVVLKSTGEKIEADYFIIAAGAIQTVKLIANSIDDLKINKDILGKDFTDHISSRVGSIDLGNYKKLNKSLTPYFKGRNFYYPRIQLPKKIQEKYFLPGAFLHLQIIGKENSTLENIKVIFRSIQEGKFYFSDLKNLKGLFFDFSYFIKLSVSKIFGLTIPVPKDSKLELFIDVEQVPSKNNRLVRDESLLSDELTLHWKINENTTKTIRIFLDYLQDEVFRKMGIEITRYEEKEIEKSMIDAYHPCGGTKMGYSRENSIVNSDLKVHNFENIFILSTSVFPTSATANPGFTLICLAFRLNKLLKKIL